jgi:transposase
MIIKKVKETTSTVKTKTISLVMAIANQIIDELGFVETINKNAAEWDESHWRLSPGHLVKALVLTTFTDMRSPLTHLQDRLESLDLEYLIGWKALYNDINAFNVGRALERIGEGDINASYEQMAIEALCKYDIPTSQINSDTTTLSFSGEYDIEKMNLTDEAKEELLRIEKGYNKDGRPGDAQVVVGQMVNEHGIPLTCRTLNGATSDVEWNKQALDYFDKLRENGLGDGIYVADCKVVTEELVTRMNSDTGRINFVSRCPANFDNRLAHRMVANAYKADNWEEMGQISDVKDASGYRASSHTENVCGSPTRLIVLESTSLMAKATVELEKLKEKIKPIVATLEKKEFACSADAEEEYARFSALKELNLFQHEAEIMEIIKEKWPRGRRGKDTKPIITKTYQVRINNIELDGERSKEFFQNESTLVLISNIDQAVKTDKEVLETYKGQHVVENSFRHLKHPSVASVIYLNNPKRIEALSMLLHFSLLVRAIIQFRMREGLIKHNEENPDVPIYAGWNGRPLTSPTYRLLYEHSINCRYERMSGSDEYTFNWVNVETKRAVTSLLALMGLTVLTIL